MKCLHFTLYLRGHCGFSNLMMSMELGVVASFLLDRVLVIEGNVTPPANVVKYPGKGVTNRHRSRVTDLVELPVPWLEDWQVDYDPARAVAMSRGNVMDAEKQFRGAVTPHEQYFFELAKRVRRRLSAAHVRSSPATGDRH
jgi:hypothetical protein